MNEVMGQIKDVFKGDRKMTQVFSTLKIAKLTGWETFVMVGMTNHYILGLFFSKSQGSKMTDLGIAYGRSYYQMATCMMFCVATGMTNTTGLILTTAVMPLVSTGVVFCLKKLTENEGAYGTSLFKWFGENKLSKVQPKSNSDQVVSEREPSLSKDGVKDRSLEKEGTKPGIKHKVASFNKPSCCPKITHIEDIGNEVKKTLGGKVKVLAGYALTYALVPLSLGLVTLATKSGSVQRTWPPAYWYAISCIYDITLGQLPMIAIQYVLFHLHTARRHLYPPKMFSSKPFFLDNSLSHLTGLSDTIKFC
jgi:hypothetical protein